MFNKLQGIKPTGRQTAANPQFHGHTRSYSTASTGSAYEQEQGREHTIDDTPSENSPPLYHQPTVAPTAPTLPPIARVASQYGSFGSLSFDELAKKYGHIETESKVESTDTEKEHPEQQSMLELEPERSTTPTSELPPPRRSSLEVPIKSAGSSAANTKASDLPLRKSSLAVPVRSQLPTVAPKPRIAKPLQPPPKLNIRSQSPKGQARTQAETKSPSQAPSKVPQYPRPPSRESPRRPFHDVPRPPSSLRESFTAPNPAPKEAPEMPPPPPPSLLSKELMTSPPPSTSRSDMFVPQHYARPSSSSGSSSATTFGNSMPAQPQKSSKPILNRFNPMQFLARRRSTQPEAAVEAPVPKRNMQMSLSTVPDDYDPRIRGTGIHDFSAPKPKRFVSEQYARSASDTRLHSTNLTKEKERLVPQDPKHAHVNTSERNSEADKPHTPVFKEHFGDEIDGVWRYDENDPRNKVTTKILDRVPAPETQVSSSLPPFARRFADDGARSSMTPRMPTAAPLPNAHNRPVLDKSLPPSPASSSVTPHDRSEERKEPQKAPALRSESQTPKASLQNTHNERSHTLENDPESYGNRQATPPPQPSSPPKSSTRSTPNNESPFQPAGLPKHLLSTASRFSFDLAGVGSSAQEKLLEDKHRQRAAKRDRSSTISGNSIAESNDGVDYDDIDFDDNGLEEDIPGMNDDDDDFHGFTGVANSTLDDSNASAPAPRSGLGALSNSWNMSQPLQLQPNALGMYNMPQSFSETALPTINTSIHQDPFNRQTASARPGLQSERATRVTGYEDDDLYFDDGDIDVGVSQGERFDESVFEDDTNPIFGLPLRDQRPRSGFLDSNAGDSSQQSTRPISSESGLANVPPIRTTADTSRTSVQPAEVQTLEPKPSVVVQEDNNAKSDERAGLTQDNLAAYHDALALAATKAASEGRFERKYSMDSIAQEQAQGGQPRVSFNEQELGQGMRPLSDEPAGFKFDDDYDMDDDEFVAAANAEALENDDEGFYGQEFGFYARAHGDNEASYINGGYFGPSGKDMPKRSFSGRANGQDPILTPITERSEFSQRNSMISLVHGGSYPPNIQNQGLAQLADQLQHEDQHDDLSLSALQKLRRGAFGASSTSLHSGSGSQKSPSPPVYGFPSPPIITNPSGMQLGGGAASIAGASYSYSGTAGKVQSPTGAPGSASLMSPLLRMNSDELVLSPTHGMNSGNDTSPKRRNAIGKGHSRNSSNADSVTYIKEEDEDGGGRWVMERRRTGDQGQIEVLGRQVVEGGRI